MNRLTIHIGLLLFAAAASACARERTNAPAPAPAHGTQAIGFSVADKVTRSVTMNASDILSLGIFGYSTGDEDFNPNNTAHTPNLFANRKAARTEESSVLTPWTYAPAAAWPSDDTEKNTFFAYSPYMDEFPTGSMTVITGESSSGYPQIYYKVPSKVSEQVDLLYSEYFVSDNGTPPVLTPSPDVSNINYNTNTANPGYVKYTMKHATIWIRFLIATVQEADVITPEPESYTVTEFYMVGGNIVAGGVFDMGAATWRPAPEMVGSDGYEAVTYEFDHLWDEPLVVPAGDTAPLTGVEDCLMMIPQDFVTSENLTSVAISYTHDDGSGSPSNTEYYVTLPFPDVKLGRAGYVMTYVVKLSTSGAWIEFQNDNTIEKWLEDNTTPREIDVF